MKGLYILILLVLHFCAIVGRDTILASYGTKPQDREFNLPGGQYAYMYVKITEYAQFYYHLRYNSKKESVNGFIGYYHFMERPHIKQDEDDAPFPYVVIEPISTIMDRHHVAFKGKMTVMVGTTAMASLDFDLDNVKNPE